MPKLSEGAVLAHRAAITVLPRPSARLTGRLQKELFSGHRAGLAFAALMLVGRGPGTRGEGNQWAEDGQGLRLIGGKVRPQSAWVTESECNQGTRLGNPDHDVAVREKASKPASAGLSAHTMEMEKR